MADNENNCFREAVCIDAGRVYDSCCSRDCLEDLQLYFNPSDQTVINDSSSVRLRSAQIVDVDVSVEPVTFNRGFYNVSMTFFFSVTLDAYSCANGVTTITPVTGIAYLQKTAILFGSDGNAQVYSSNNISNSCTSDSNSPVANVQTVDPVLLGADIVPTAPTIYNTCTFIPCVLELVGGTVAPQDTVTQYATVNLGIFTVVQLVRNVQMLVPVYDFCIPQKECQSGTDEPCDLFNTIAFPMDEFFPPREIIPEESGCTACDEK